MWLTPEQITIDDDAPYTAPNGTSYPGNFPKSEIAGLLHVTTVAQPATTSSQTVSRDGVEFVDGQWRQKWAVSNLSAEVIAANLVATRASIWTQIKAVRDTKIQTGGYQASGKWFHSDTFSRTQQIGLVMMGASVPPVPWKTMDGTFVTMTQALAGAIFQAAAAHDVATFNHAESLKAQVDAAADPSAIDINAGWPATFA